MDWEAVARLLAEKSTFPVALLDQEGSILLFNRAMETALGWSRFDVVAKPWAKVCTPHANEDEARRWIADALRGAIDGCEVVAVTSRGQRVGLTLECSLVGRGAEQVLLLVATHTQVLQVEVGSFDGEDLDYEVSLGPEFGQVVRLHRGGEALQLVEPARCFTLMYQRASPCEDCPLVGDDEPWPRTRVKPLSLRQSMVELRTAERLEGRVRVRVRMLPELALQAIHTAKVDALARHADLSRREKEILTYLLQGRSIEDIAHAIGIAVRTVKYHQTNVLQKLGAESRSDLLRLFF
ncbi:MAG: PAS domain S-box protein [Deltaproteobacteria bacterium]|nr:PAS domain S-box protein [Deltaproteobacteria bacterium]MCW5801675.1 PAS domain S-box protein [Deltaproteobacteria bacterium]